MTDLDWTPIAPGFGAEVHGLDIAAPVSSATGEALRALWLERGLLLFRGQPISDEAQVRLTEAFGPTPIHRASDTHVSSQRELITIAHSPDEADQTMQYLVNGRPLANWQPWHIDTIYTDEIEHGGMLRAIEVPEEGIADTGFIDRGEVYDRLPDDLRREAEGVRVLYHLNPVMTDAKFNYYREAREHFIPERTRRMRERAIAEFAVVSHPAVIAHPVTGRKVMNIGTMHAIGIEGRENAEGDALLHRLVAASVELGDKYYHKWRKDDVVVWDNWRLLHSAEGTPLDVTRKLLRSGIAGTYGLGREVRMLEVAA